MSTSPKTFSEARALALRSLEVMTPEEDAEIARGIEADPDAKELTDEDFAEMKPSRLGRPPKPPEERKRSVTLRLDPDVLAAYAATGKGWQTRINDILRKAAPQSHVRTGENNGQRDAKKVGEAG